MLLVKAMYGAEPAHTPSILVCGAALINVLSEHPHIYSGASPEMRGLLKDYVGQLIRLSNEHKIASHTAATASSVRSACQISMIEVVCVQLISSLACLDLHVLEPQLDTLLQLGMDATKNTTQDVFEKSLGDYLPHM